MLRATGESMMDETPRIDRPENRSREAVKGKESEICINTFTNFRLS